MDFTLDSAWANVQTGWAQVSALLVSYSFSVIGAFILLFGGWIVAGLVERYLYTGLTQIRGFDVTICRFFASLARYAILILVTVMVLGQFGVQTASIIAAIGAIGLAIGLALQGTLQNIAAGIMLLFLRPFRIGESIVVGPVDGDVEEIGLFATRLRAADGTYILAPNAKLWNEPVRNSTRNRARRNDITVALSYSVDVDEVEAILLELAAADKRVKKLPEPKVFVAELSPTAMMVTFRYWTTDKDFFSTKIALNRLIKARFDQQGIGLPVPAAPPAPVPAEPEDVGQAKEVRRAAPTRQ